MNSANEIPSYLETIEEMGRLLMTPREVAINIETPFSAFCEYFFDEQSEEYKAYQKGIMKTKIAHAHAVLGNENTSDENRMVRERIQLFEEQLILQIR